MFTRFIRHVKEGVLLLMAASLAGVVIYTHAENNALGLLPNVYSADFVPATITFRSDVLTSEQMLDLNLNKRFGLSAEQIELVYTDPTVPAPVEDFSVLNTRIGGEVALFWTKPEQVEGVTIYKQYVNEKGEVVNTLVLENSKDISAIDTDVQNGVAYTYSAISVHTAEDGTVYSAQEIPQVTVTPADEIAPHAPTEVVVQSYEDTATEEKGIQLTWKNPTDDDLESVAVHRSEQYGSRGVEVARLSAQDPEEYIDVAVIPNTTYYYTVVAYDLAGNASGADFAIPQPGNTDPFSPIE